MELIKLLHTEKIRGHYTRFALFYCDLCKKEVVKRKGHGKITKTCGCKWNHGGRYTRLYKTWAGMKSRCNNKKDKAYKTYGGRGIKVCKEWEYFVDFRKWALNSGYDDSFTIDRIDNYKGYSSLNCRWVTFTENNRNRRNNKLTHSDVREIKRLFNTGNYKNKILADKYNVSNTMISNIIHNKAWKGVNP